MIRRNETAPFFPDKGEVEEHNKKVRSFMGASSAAHGRGSMFLMHDSEPVKFTESQLEEYEKALGIANIAAFSMVGSVRTILEKKRTAQYFASIEAARADAIMAAAEESADSIEDNEVNLGTVVAEETDDLTEFTKEKAAV